MENTNCIKNIESKKENFPKEWRFFPLANVIDFNPKRELEKGMQSKFISMADVRVFTKKISSFSIKKFSSGKKFKNGDTIMARITPCLENGKTSFIDFLKESEVASGSTEFIVLSGKKDVSDSNFVYYLSISPSIRSIAIKTMTGTSGRQRVDNEKFADSMIALPSMTEQKQIAEILSSFDDKIELNRKINSSLEKLASLLFKHYFIDIGDTLPYGWSIGKIGDFAKVKSGFAFKGGDFKNVGVPVIKIKNVIDPEISFKNVDCISERIVEEKAQDFILKPKDILIAMSGNTTGKIGIMPKTKNYYVLNQRVGKYFLKDEKNLGYLYFYLRSGDVQKDIIQSAYGSAQPNISPSILENMKILIPKKEVLDNFNKISNEIIDIISNNNFENDTLSELRDSLLSKLMNGKIRVN